MAAFCFAMISWRRDWRVDLGEWTEILGEHGRDFVRAGHQIRVMLVNPGALGAVWSVVRVPAWLPKHERTDCSSSWLLVGQLRRFGKVKYLRDPIRPLIFYHNCWLCLRCHSKPRKYQGIISKSHGKTPKISLSGGMYPQNHWLNIETVLI